MSCGSDAVEPCTVAKSALVSCFVTAELLFAPEGRQHTCQHWMTVLHQHLGTGVVISQIAHNLHDIV